MVEGEVVAEEDDSPGAEGDGHEQPGAFGPHEDVVMLGQAIVHSYLL